MAAKKEIAKKDLKKVRGGISNEPTYKTGKKIASKGCCCGCK